MDFTSASVKRLKSQDCRICSLDKGIRVNILTRIGAFKYVDYFSAITSCKGFLEVSKYCKVIEKVSVEWILNDDYTIRKDCNGARKFLDLCREKNNHDVDFWDGMKLFFNDEMQRIGRMNFDYASDGGHFDATFVKGMILLSEDDENEKEGFQLLNNLHQKHGEDWRIIADTLTQCRRMLKGFQRINFTTFKKDQVFCPVEAHNWKRRTVRKLLRKLREDKSSVCKTCLWCAAYDHFRDGMQFIHGL